MRIVRLLFAAVMGAVAVRAADADSVTVENQQVSLTFGTQPVPSLRALVLKSSGANLVSGVAPLFVLQVAQTNGVVVSVESQQAKRGTVEVGTVPGGKRMRLAFEGLGPSGDMRVALEGVLDDSEPFVRWSVAVGNPSRLRLASVRFPHVSAVPAIGSPDDDFIIAPASPGTLIENPSKNWPNGYSLSWNFPGDQSAQFCAYQDRVAGVYLASMDSTGYKRTLQVSKQKDGYRLSHCYQVSDAADTEWKSPYEVVFGVTSGTWQQTADIYKRWASRQPWCGKTLVQRAEIPSFWKQGPCIHTCEVRTYGGQNQLCNGSYYPKLEEHLRLLREKIGGPVVPMLPGWENHRRWTAGEYFPVFDQEQAKGVLGRIRQDGFRPFFYLSGLFYTYQNEGRDGEDRRVGKATPLCLWLTPRRGSPKPTCSTSPRPTGNACGRGIRISFVPPRRALRNISARSSIRHTRWVSIFFRWIRRPSAIGVPIRAAILRTGTRREAESIRSKPSGICSTI